jgi:hypothetical protein
MVAIREPITHCQAHERERENRRVTRRSKRTVQRSIRQIIVYLFGVTSVKGERIPRDSDFHANDELFRRVNGTCRCEIYTLHNGRRRSSRCLATQDERERGEEKRSLPFSSRFLLFSPLSGGMNERRSTGCLTVTHVRELNQYDRHVTIPKEGRERERKSKLNQIIINGKTESLLAGLSLSILLFQSVG